MYLDTVGNRITEIAGDVSQVIIVFGAVFSLLNCFFGYKLVKLWAAVAGFILGFAAGFSICMHFSGSPGISSVVGIAAGLAVGCAAFFIYRVGVFLFCFFLALFLCTAFIPDWPGIVVGIVLGILVGILAMKLMREVLIVTSAVSGGMNASSALLPVFGFTAPGAIWIVGIILVAAGIFVQWKTTSKGKQEL